MLITINASILQLDTRVTVLESHIPNHASLPTAITISNTDILPVVNNSNNLNKTNVIADHSYSPQSIENLVRLALDKKNIKTNAKVMSSFTICQTMTFCKMTKGY